MARIFPTLVAKLCYSASAWIVGGGAREPDPKDWDIVVPMGMWNIASQLIPEDARPNTFGGWKCVSEGKSIDVWPAELGQLMTNEMVRHLWHPQSGARFNRQLRPGTLNEEQQQ